MKTNILLGILLIINSLLSPIEYQAEKIVFVSSFGNDTNSCSIDFPCKTISKAMSLSPDKIYLRQGTYLPFTFSGSNYEVSSYNGEQVNFVGLNKAGEIVLNITGSGIKISNISVSNSGWAGVSVSGDYSGVYNIKVYETVSHGVILKGKGNFIENSYVTDVVTENRPISNVQWGSCIKGEKGATDVRIIGNKIENCYGEGIAVTMTKGATIQKNYVDTAYAVGIYVDNSDNIKVDKNFIYCVDPAFMRNGTYSASIAMSNEDYSYLGWSGGILGNIYITNNLIYQCSGISYWKDLNYGIKNLYISHNSFWNTSGNAAIGVEYASGQTNINITNNILKGSVWVENTSGGVINSNNQQASLNIYKQTPDLYPENWSLLKEISVPYVNVDDDFLGNSRYSVYSIGAIQYLNSITPTYQIPTNTFTSTPVITYTNTKTVTPTKANTPSFTPTISSTPFQSVIAEISYRGKGKNLNIRDIASIYGNTVGVFYPYSQVEILNIIKGDSLSPNNVWGKIGYKMYIPLYYNGVYYTNWRE